MFSRRSPHLICHIVLLLACMVTLWIYLREVEKRRLLIVLMSYSQALANNDESKCRGLVLPKLRDRPEMTHLIRQVHSPPMNYDLTIDLSFGGTVAAVYDRKD